MALLHWPGVLITLHLACLALFAVVAGLERRDAAKHLGDDDVKGGGA
ncbi:hypothetical protein [Caudoviricetes sp.]|nr:hypothetical protein [Caudoviricetes sp.]